MTPPRLFRPGDRLPPRNPSYPPFRHSPLRNPGFQKRPVTTSVRPRTLPSSMTVCIAAVLPRAKKIILASDELISFGWTSVDGSLKLECLGPNERWTVMFAADDARRARAIILSIREALGDGESTAEVIAACKAGYRDQLAEMFETEALRPFGLTLSEFETKGRAYFGDLGLNDIRRESALRDTGVTLLVAGFDIDKTPELFEVTPRGHVTEQYGWNFLAIGSGADKALASLYPYPDLCESQDLHHIVYRVCAAKFAAESASGVGPKTNISCIDENGETAFLLGREVDDLRDVWRNEGQPPFPDNARKLIEANLVSIEQIIRRSAMRGREGLNDFTVIQPPPDPQRTEDP